MIDFANQVPTIYTSASRDFQYMSWLINVVLNSVKHNVDDLYYLPEVGNNYKLAELFALTLGFKIKRNYNQEQLMVLAAVLPRILKAKGTITAVKMAADALITATGAIGDADYEIVDSQLQLYIPADKKVDLTLFIDLLDYILPAGMTCRVIRENREKVAVDSLTITPQDYIQVGVHDDLAWDNGMSTGLSGLLDVGQEYIGKAISKESIGSALEAIDVSIYSNTVDNPPTATVWQLVVSHEANKATAVTIEKDNEYLAIAADRISLCDGDFIWQLIPGVINGTFRLYVTKDDTCKYLAYDISKSNSVFDVVDSAEAGVVDLCLYKKIGENKYAKINDITAITADDYIIVAQNIIPEISANYIVSDTGYELNAGLLSNTIIPVLNDYGNANTQP